MAIFQLFFFSRVGLRTYQHSCRWCYSDSRTPPRPRGITRKEASTCDSPKSRAKGSFCLFGLQTFPSSRVGIYITHRPQVKERKFPSTVRLGNILSERHCPEFESACFGPNGALHSTHEKSFDLTSFGSRGDKTVRF